MAQGCATGRPTSGFFQVFNKSWQILKKAGKFFEKIQSAARFFYLNSFL
jgi:hypothetical protein